MRWTLAGCCGMVLMSLSVAMQIKQKPRFYGLKTGRHVEIYCICDNQSSSTVEWYKGGQKIMRGKNVGFRHHGKNQNAIITLAKVTTEDSGIYSCKQGENWGPGTEVLVVRHIKLAEAQYRTKMKDGLIVLQALMMAVCIAAVLFQKQRQKSKDNDSFYEDPDNDHIYEGLAIETCGGDLYEDLSVYAQAEGAEAPWE